jgi:4-hydroxy-tetrahydrodipicolinate reductase
VVDTFNDGLNEYPVYENISQCKENADVIIDFSNSGAVDGLLTYAVEKKIPLVLCTTGPFG